MDKKLTNCMYALSMIISTFIAHLKNHFRIPCESSATEILCLLHVRFFHILRHIKKNSIYDVYGFIRYLYQCYSSSLFGVVSIAQLVEVTDSAALGGVVEVVSSNPARVINIFSILPA